MPELGTGRLRVPRGSATQGGRQALPEKFPAVGRCCGREFPVALSRALRRALRGEAAAAGRGGGDRKEL